MARSAARWFGLAVIGAAAVACWRAWRRRSAVDDHADRTDHDVPSAPSLVVVPEPDPEPVPEPASVATTAEAADGADEADGGPAAVRPSALAPSAVVEPTAAAAASDGQRWADPIDGACPDGYPIKVNERSGIYHVPEGLSYERTSPTRCYATVEDAEADGFRRAKR